MQEEEKLDQSFVTLLTIGILVQFDSIDLATVKKLFADAILACGGFERLIELREYRRAWEIIEQTGFGAGFEPELSSVDVLTNYTKTHRDTSPVDLSAGFEPDQETEVQ